MATKAFASIRVDDTVDSQTFMDVGLNPAGDADLEFTATMPLGEDRNDITICVSPKDALALADWIIDHIRGDKS